MPLDAVSGPWPSLFHVLATVRWMGCSSASSWHNILPHHRLCYYGQINLPLFKLIYLRCLLQWQKYDQHMGDDFSYHSCKMSSIVYNFTLNMFLNWGWFNWEKVLPELLAEMIDILPCGRDSPLQRIISCKMSADLLLRNLSFKILRLAEDKLPSPQLQPVSSRSWSIWVWIVYHSR